MFQIPLLSMSPEERFSDAILDKISTECSEYVLV